MNTKEYLSKILPTVKDLLSWQGHKQESEILQINNITYEEDYDVYGNVLPRGCSMCCLCLVQ